MGETLVIPATDSRLHLLESQGWVVSGRSFGAALAGADVSVARLERLIARVEGAVRELTVADLGAVLELDARTVTEYPGGAATRHTPLTNTTAVPSPSRRGFGAFAPDGELVAMTYLDVLDSTAETDFTVADPAWRGRGLGTAVKAASVLTLFAEGVTQFRTGGSTENGAILRANSTIGYVCDEEWITITSST